MAVSNLPDLPHGLRPYRGGGTIYAMKNAQGLRSLPLSERIQLVEDLWDSIAEETGAIKLTEAQRAELDRRLDEFEANPSGGMSWEEFKAKLKS